MKRQASFARNREILREWGEYLESEGIDYETPAAEIIDAARAEQDGKNIGVIAHGGAA
jgi:hypothetical protein